LGFIAMSTETPSLSTDQLAALVELARLGSLRAAAERLVISEQGLRNRLLALEQRLGVQLYRKSRGPRRSPPLTEQGQRFLPHAVDLLRRARELCEIFDESAQPAQVHIVASQYLILYVLIDAVRRFHRAFPRIRIRLTALTEQAIQDALLGDPAIALGVAAPYEPARELDYLHLFSLNWSFIAPRGHPLLGRRRLTLADLADEPLILLERGSAGWQHVADALLRAGVVPRVEMETTNTELIVRMVEAGLGVSIVPLPAGGAVTRGRKVGVRSLGSSIRSIDSGILTRRGEQLSPASRQFVEFVHREVRRAGGRGK
jgi:DNA-binding transcriptional LysR family regulator